MKNLGKLLLRQFQIRHSNLLPVAFLLISFVGFLDAAYLTIKHYSGTPVFCSEIFGCEKVLTSKFATVGPVPVALAGVFYYLVIFLATIFYLDTKKEVVLKLVAYFTIIGFLVSVFLLYLQLFVIGSICLFCLASAITSTLLFILGIFFLLVLKFGKNI